MPADSILTINGNKIPIVLHTNPLPEYLPIVISIIQVFSVIYIFWKTRTYQNESIKLERLSIWFREIIFMPNQKVIEALFSSINHAADATINSIQSTFVGNPAITLATVQTSFVGPFDSAVEIFENEFVSLLPIFDVELADRVRLLRSNLQDSVNDEFDRMVSASEFPPMLKERISGIIQMHRVNLYQILTDFDTKNLSPSS
jgi:hypothetical protein